MAEKYLFLVIKYNERDCFVFSALKHFRSKMCPVPAAKAPPL